MGIHNNFHSDEQPSSSNQPNNVADGDYINNPNDVEINRSTSNKRSVISETSSYDNLQNTSTKDNIEDSVFLSNHQQHQPPEIFADDESISNPYSPNLQDKFHNSYEPKGSPNGAVDLSSGSSPYSGKIQQEFVPTDDLQHSNADKHINFTDPEQNGTQQHNGEKRSHRFPSQKIKKRHSLTNQLGRSTSRAFRRISKHIPVVQKYVHDDDDELNIDTERTIYFNQELPEYEKDPETGGLLHEYPRNKIRTSKYTPLNFIPLNLYHQFHNIANIYFLFIVILGAFPIFGVLDAALAAVPIIAIVVITAIKDAIEDYRRTVLDLEVNNTMTHKLMGISNPNIEEDIINPWRRFKKASTKTSVRMLRACTRAFNKTFRKEKVRQQELMEKQLRKQRAQNQRHLETIGEGVELHAVQTRATVFSHDSASIYDATRLHGNSLDLDRYGVKSKVTLQKDGTVLDRLKPSAGHAKFHRAYWKQVNVGDIVKLYNDDEVPADVIILSTSDDDGACYIETRNLDGETNLKVRQSLKATQAIRHARDLEQCSFQVESEGPHLDLYSYSGVVKWKQRQDPLRFESPVVDRAEAVSISNMLLRGCTLRNTKWVIGIVIYSGRDSKIMMNSGITPSKRSRLTRELNIYVVINFFILFIFALITGILNGISFRSERTSKRSFEFGSIGSTPAVNGIITFWAAVILLQNLIPISLYITIEIVKSFQAFFIYQDCHMYYGPIDYRCTPKSWSISDDLGQIEYIFSDKTGTLTQNVMEFKKCTINGRSYGRAFTEAMVGIMKREGTYTDEIAQAKRQEIIEDKQLMLNKLRRTLSQVGSRNSIDLMDNLDDQEVTFVSSEMIDHLQGGMGPEQAQSIYHFLLVLSLCHAVLPERAKDGSNKLIYKAQSPDESALVSFARDMGFALTERTRNGVIINEQGTTHEYEVLQSLEFNSARKRMSVIVRMPGTGKIYLFCKGADNVIYSRLKPNCQHELRQATSDQLEVFAKEGLRTLCLAQKELSVEEYNDWAARHELASQALNNREEQMEMVADEIERDLYLIGGTAIEDRLQDGVPETIELLSRAGIKLWVLTGDKVETAINIGFSCNLLDPGMELIFLQFPTKTLDYAIKDIDDKLQKYFGLEYNEETMKKAREDHSVPSREYAIILDGDSLELIGSAESDEDATRKGLRERFVLLCKQCRSVLCCRVSPSQKALVVSSVKSTLDVTTLAIGDGANDVAMIQEADVGVGIAGLEGRQAVMSSDYGFGQFRFLSRLVLVHGRWAYRRVAEMTANMFYKNVVFTLTLFWYNVHNDFDCSYLFDYTYITLFNLAFTSLPVIFMGFLDQDVNDKISLAVPELYRRGILRKEWTQWKFWIYITDGIYQSAVCYFLAYCMIYNGGFITENGRQNAYREGYGTLVATSAILACDFYVLINEYMWDWVFGLIVAISILLVFFWTGVYTAFTASSWFYKAAPEVYGALGFWAYLLLATLACLLPRWSAKCYQKMFMPRDIDIIREQWKNHEFDYLKEEPIDEDEEDQRMFELSEMQKQRLEEDRQYLQEEQSAGSSNNNNINQQNPYDIQHNNNGSAMYNTNNNNNIKVHEDEDTATSSSYNGAATTIQQQV